MKKKTIISIIIIVILIIVIAGYFYIKYLNEKAKNYEIAEITNYNYFVVKQGDKYGVIDNKANTIIDTKYDNVKIPNPEKGIFICYDGENTKVLNEKNQEIYTQYQNIEPLELKNVSTNLIYEKSILKYKKDEKYGLLSLEGKKIADAKYEEIDTLQYKEGELLIKQDGKYGIINQNGYEIIKPNYDSIKADQYYSNTKGYKNDGYIVSNTTEDGYRYGYINNEGKEILEVKYNELSRISNNNDNEIYILCAENGRYGVFKEDKQIIPNEYQEITYMTGTNFCTVQKGRKYGVITLEGKMILQPRFIQIDVTGNYIYATNENSEVEVYDEQGNKAQISANTIVLKLAEDEKYQIHIDEIDGKTVYSLYEGENKKTEAEYSYMEYLFGDYLIVANAQGKLGAINKNGEEKIELKYDSIQKIQGSTAVQALETANAKTTIYSSNLNQTAEMLNARINKKENYIEMYNQTEKKYFDLQGNEKTNTEIFTQNKLFAKEENGKWGFVDKEGRTVIPCQYEQVTEFNKYGFAGIKQDGKWGSIDEAGQIKANPTYEIENAEDVVFLGEYHKVEYGYGESYYTK